MRSDSVKRFVLKILVMIIRFGEVFKKLCGRYGGSVIEDEYADDLYNATSGYDDIFDEE